MRAEQAFLDKTMIDLDGTDNKSRLGANAMLAVSMAVARAAAEEAGLPLYRYFGGMGGVQLPVPMMNVINGGAHANNSLDLQEFMIIPVGRAHLPRSRALGRRGVPRAQEAIIHDQGMSTAVGDEGGFAPSVENHEAAIQLILEAIEEAGYKAGEQIALGLDCASLRVLQRRHVRPEGRRQYDLERHPVDRHAGWLVRQVPHHLHRRRHARRRLGWLEDPDRAPGRRRCSWWVTICS